jgi:hypothetical protein
MGKVLSLRADAWGSIGSAIVPLTLVLLASTGCATLVNGSSQDIRVATQPRGATVLLRCPDGDRRVSELTPASIRLSRRGRACTLVLSKAGYRPATIELVKKVSPWSLGNVVTCGCGLAVDAVTGGMFAFVPGSIEVTLEPSDATDREVDR